MPENPHIEAGDALRARARHAARFMPLGLLLTCLVPAGQVWSGPPKSPAAPGEAPAAPQAPPTPVSARVDLDLSAGRGMLAVLQAMRDGTPREQVVRLLDGVLAARPYRVMFRHYNRSWRPNHLPEDVFKRMILSLRFDQEYTPGENELADRMRARWTRSYPDLAPWEARMRRLEGEDLPRLVNEGVALAQGWLPEGWEIPAFYLPIIPHGGSPAFTVDGAQGYDFLQLSDRPGEVDLARLAATVAHESHHLGMRSTMPAGLSPRDRLAYQVISMTIPEGAATAFLSAPPEGCTRALPAPVSLFTPDLVREWDRHVAAAPEIVRRQAGLLDRALSGDLTEEELDRQMRDDWFSGGVGPAYVMGAEMLRAIHLAQGKTGVFAVMQDPRHLFERYDAALEARPDALGRCAPVPAKAVAQALGIGSR